MMCNLKGHNLKFLKFERWKIKISKILRCSLLILRICQNIILPYKVFWCIKEYSYFSDCQKIKEKKEKRKRKKELQQKQIEIINRLLSSSKVKVITLLTIQRRKEKEHVIDRQSLLDRKCRQNEPILLEKLTVR